VGAVGYTRAGLRWVLERGVPRAQPVDVRKRIRLCNLLALLGAAMMAIWFAVEVRFGDPRNLAWETAFVLGFGLVLALNARRHGAAARIVLLLVANACVAAGSLLFADAGGHLPFFALAALPLLLFGPREWVMIAGGAALPVLLFALCDSGVLARLLGLHPRLAPGWYLAANALSAFAVAFLVPLVFYRSNLQAEAALERAGQERLKRVLDSDLIGVVRGKLSGQIEDANDTFLGLLGYTRKDLLAGTIDFGVIAPADWASALGGRAGAAAAGCAPGLVYERSCRRNDGTSVPTLVGVARLDDTDEVIGFVLDLSAQKHVQTQRALIAESEQALRLRDLFTSIASHELKTPLTALMLNLRLARRRLDRGGEGSDGVGAQVERCEAAGRRMGDLIDSLLDVAQMHGGRLKLARRETDVVEAVRRAVSDFALDRTDGGQAIAVHAVGAVTAPVDGVRFQQVLTNLLSNAVKYGDGKPIEVRVAREAASNVARVEVIDGGPGLEPNLASRVFDPFERAAAARPIPGLGLGLYVVKMIVEGHGGHVEVDSRPGRGARFIVDLPCTAELAAAPA
jgi:PAS domain S-box-containing protein